MLHNAFFTEIDLALSLPTGLDLGAADRKIRDLHVRGFCHSSEYISYGTESEKKGKMGFKYKGAFNCLRQGYEKL